MGRQNIARTNHQIYRFIIHQRKNKLLVLSISVCRTDIGRAEVKQRNHNWTTEKWYTEPGIKSMKPPFHYSVSSKYINRQAFVLVALDVREWRGMETPQPPAAHSDTEALLLKHISCAIVAQTRASNAIKHISLIKLYSLRFCFAGASVCAILYFAIFFFFHFFMSHLIPWSGVFVFFCSLASQFSVHLRHKHGVHITSYWNRIFQRCCDFSLAFNTAHEFTTHKYLQQITK